MSESPTIQAVLFDMGGVLVELGPLDEFLGIAIPSEEFWPKWLASPIVREFERGGCTTDDFGQGLRDEFDLTLTAEEVVERFRGFPRGLFPGAADLVGSVIDGVATAVLSNTNQLHWEEQTDAVIVQTLFDHRFLSYEMGLVKPDAAMFERVIAELDLRPDQVLFIDDNQVNVEGAAAIGIDAEVGLGVEQARRILTDRNLLAPPAAG